MLLEYSKQQFSDLLSTNLHIQMKIEHEGTQLHLCYLSNIVAGK